MKRKTLLLSAALLLFSFTSNAQFKKLLNKAKEKAIEAVTGDKDSAQPDDAPQQPQQSDASDETTAQSDDADNTKKENTPAPVVFPVTGDTVTAMHAVFAPVIDGDIKRITNTPEGRYAISIARQKGLKGSDMEIFRQLLDPKNEALSEAVSEEVEKKFPAKENNDRQVSGNFILLMAVFPHHPSISM